MNDSKLVSWAVRNVAGVILYVAAVVWLMSNAEHGFGAKPGILIGVAILMLFVCSALITGLLVLGQPVWLFVNGQKKESLKLLGYTVGAMFAAMVIVWVTLAFLA
jgi:hypothetical protein